MFSQVVSSFSRIRECGLAFHGHRIHLFVLAMHYQGSSILCVSALRGTTALSPGCNVTVRHCQRLRRPSQGVCRHYRRLSLAAEPCRHAAARFPGPPRPRRLCRRTVRCLTLTGHCVTGAASRGPVTGDGAVPAWRVGLSLSLGGMSVPVTGSAASVIVCGYSAGSATQQPRPEPSPTTGGR